LLAEDVEGWEDRYGLNWAGILKNSRFDLNVKIESKMFTGIYYYRLAEGEEIICWPKRSPAPWWKRSSRKNPKSSPALTPPSRITTN
jgi:hypothetical protein